MSEEWRWKELNQLNPSEKLTEGDEHRIAREIAFSLLRKGATYNQCVRILEETKEKIGEIPFKQ